MRGEQARGIRAAWIAGQRFCADKAAARDSLLIKAVIIALLLCGASGCFPYKQVYRSLITGVVVDEMGSSISGADVMVCTIDRRGQSMASCPRQATAKANADGRFQLPEHAEWNWCCLGEAPRPATFLAACASRDGQQMGALFAPVSAPTNVRVSVAPVGSPSGPKQCFDLQADPRQGAPLGSR